MHAPCGQLATKRKKAETKLSTPIFSIKTNQRNSATPGEEGVKEQREARRVASPRGKKDQEWGRPILLSIN